MNKKEKLINFRVTSYDGDSNFNLPSSKAFNEIKRLAEEQNKWIFIDGKVKNKDLLTEKDLIEASENKKPIMLVNALAGGDKLIDIEFSTEKQKESIIIETSENKYAKIINIKVSEKSIRDILRNRKVVTSALKVKLDELAKKVTEDYNSKKQEELNKVMENISQEINEKEKDIEEFSKSIDY